MYHKFENMIVFWSGNLYSPCNPGNQDYHKIIHFFKKIELDNEKFVFLLEFVVIINESWYIQAYIFLIIEIADFDLFDEQKK